MSLIPQAPGPAKTPRSERRRRLLTWIVLGVCLLRVASYLVYLREPTRSDSDLTQEYVSAKAWRDGKDPYAPKKDLNARYIGAEARFLYEPEPDERNPHPPAFILLFAPLTSLGLTGARLAVLLVMLAATFVGIYLFCTTLGLAKRTAVLWGAVALATPLVQLDLRWAQVNGLLMLALVLAWRDLRQGRDTRGGAILGVAAALKLFPFLLVIPLLRARRKRAVASMVLAVLIVFGIATAVLGPKTAISSFRRASQGNYEAWAAAPQSISLVSLPVRAFSPERWRTPSAEIPGHVVVMAAGLGILALYGALRTRALASRDLFWATVPWMIVASPLAWPHYVVLCIPLAILLIRNASTFSRRRRRLFYMFAASLAVLPNLPDYLDWLGAVSFASVGVGMMVVLAILLTIALIDFGGLKPGVSLPRADSLGELPPIDASALRVATKPALGSRRPSS